MSKTEVEVNQIDIDLSGEIENILKKTGRNCAELIKRNAPKKTGDYANGWTYELENSETVRVYNNGDNATLSHLLEFGHRTKLGMTYKQRKPAKTKRKRQNSGHQKSGKKSTIAPREHIRPAYNKIAKEYEEDMKRIKLKVTIKH